MGYGNRKLVKNHVVKTKVDSYMLSDIEKIVEQEGVQRESLIRELLAESIERMKQRDMEKKRSRMAVEL